MAKTYEGVSMSRFVSSNDRLINRMNRIKNDLDKLNQASATVAENHREEFLRLEARVVQLEKGSKKK